ncbi:hypothetical protein Fcan01_11400 [Folsomia candida]|uniref:Uncharacterized protein n=1 Tax=Folsomia candida TaxID=158441 RepID=A0A226E9W6_FOLCA|nr:hypothetical protein Fcan01_11400 [Folsomia candida]
MADMYGIIPLQEKILTTLESSLSMNNCVNIYESTKFLNEELSRKAMEFIKGLAEGDETRLQHLPSTLLQLIRYAIMTSEEFAKFVVPTGLLENIAIIKMLLFYFTSIPKGHSVLGVASIQSTDGQSRCEFSTAVSMMGGTGHTLQDISGDWYLRFGEGSETVDVTYLASRWTGGGMTLSDSRQENGSRLKEMGILLMLCAKLGGGMEGETTIKQRFILVLHVKLFIYKTNKSH